MQDRFKFRTYIPDRKFFKFWGWIKKGEYKGLCSTGEYSLDELLEKYTNQCTGLKDKNGKLIYEGDIVTYDCTDLFPHTTIKTGKITWYKSSWVIGYFDNNIVYMGTNVSALQRIWLGKDDFIGSRTEVIGNIYETPELFEFEAEQQ